MADAIVRSNFLGKGDRASPKPFVLWRPTAKTGIVSWLTTVDHKRIGFLYGISALFFFLVGGVEALLTVSYTHLDVYKRQPGTSCACSTSPAG